MAMGIVLKFPIVSVENCLIVTSIGTVFSRVIFHLEQSHGTKSFLLALDSGVATPGPTWAQGLVKDLCAQVKKTN